MNDNIYVGTPEQYAEWVKSNINEIATHCNWCDVVSVTANALVLDEQERIVVNHKILHIDNTKTHLLCEVANDGLPYSAYCESKIALKSLQGYNKCGGRVVIVSPLISLNIVEEAHRNQLPICFLEANLSQCQYWECPSK